MRPHAWLFAGLCLVMLGSADAEPAQTMQSAEEAADTIAPGVWQGNWHVVRIDPRLRTRAGAELLRLSIIHDIGSGTAELSWTAGRAICEDPAGEPCEWIGAGGDSQHVLIGETGLYAVLSVSADTADPMILHLPAAAGARGVLFNARGGIVYAVAAERADDHAHREAADVESLRVDGVAHALARRLGFRGKAGS